MGIVLVRFKIELIALLPGATSRQFLVQSVVGCSFAVAGRRILLWSISSILNRTSTMP